MPLSWVVQLAALDVLIGMIDSYLEFTGQLERDSN